MIRVDVIAKNNQPMSPYFAKDQADADRFVAFWTANGAWGKPGEFQVKMTDASAEVQSHEARARAAKTAAADVRDLNIKNMNSVAELGAVVEKMAIALGLKE